MLRRKLLPLTLLAFAAFYLFTRPQAAAASVNGVLGYVTGAADSLALFLSAVLNG
ncbi:hypothetical protein AB0C27_30945 [Nonomuraea sp. NPDC048882]|uniref:hypothetical protein n=1 Tax=Nonomuraea TaxID=83681 RepID=UPI000A87E012